MKKIIVKNLGPIRSAEIALGDLTIFVGPQATGKSILLQLLKLLLDYRSIREKMRRFNLDWRGEWKTFLELYFGEGMSDIHNEVETVVQWEGKNVKLSGLLMARGPQEEQMFYIPAQRVLALRDGLTRPFTEYRAGDPFVVREFSEKVHQLVQTEFGKEVDELFPQPSPRRLKSEYRDLLHQHIFAGLTLEMKTEQMVRRLVLRSPAGRSLPFLVWSAGQREFVPLMLGLYWLMPSARVSRRAHLEWVVIEEPEMGLHPAAISAVMALVLELLHRGYKVCLSTHSSDVLSVAWALRVFREHHARPEDLLKAFQLPARRTPLRELAEDILSKEYKVYYFRRDGNVVDITSLNPAAESPEEADWGGLTEFGSRIGDVVAEVVRRSERSLPEDEG